MDLDGDGKRDLLSGSWPGELYLFRRMHGATVLPDVKLRAKDGTAINVGRASTPFAVDWDGDGDLDLLVGDVDGQVHLLLRSGEAKDLGFDDAGLLDAQGEEIAARNGDGAPVVADWDGDGRGDLLLGAGDGSVRWFRDTATKGTPVLAAGIELVPEGRTEAPRKAGPYRGYRSKVCVWDWNGDGRTDLLLGDFSTGGGEESVLTPEQAAEREKLAAEQDELTKQWTAVMKRIQEKVKAEGIREDTKPFAERVQLLVEQDEASHPVRDQLMGVFRRLAALDGGDEAHGHVWVFLRKAAAGSSQSR